MLAQDSEGKTELQPSGIRVVEQGIGKRNLPIYIEPIKRSDLGKIWERKKKKRLEAIKLLLPKE